MSTEGSVTSSGIRQFGLYRTIDAKTEEFLRLSRKRQIRQGCACAAISTAITVTIVIIVLLIYEYMIVVETNAVQKRTAPNKIRFVGKDKPIAERLDRSHFGFDQDYYERMPLLVNALQEVSYIDPVGEASVSRSRKRHYSRNRYKSSTTTADNRFIRRTSPRPFIFEYRSPYPMPFSKTQGTPRSWVEHYRNAQRLKNLHDVVKYLEKTLNAKFGDVYLPTRAQIAFSGVYVPPTENKNRDSYLPINDNVPQESQNYNVKSNHNSDPLYTFRPDSPGDINLLADGFKFAPSAFSSQNNLKGNSVKHVFRTVTERNMLQNCRNVDCSSDHLSFANKAELESSQELDIQKYDNGPKLVDIKVNVISSPKPSTENTLNRNIDKIYITSPRPIFQFRRKSTVPFRRSIYTHNRPNIFVEKRKNITITTSKQPEKIEDDQAEETTVRSTIQNYVKLDYMTDYPTLNYSHVEDYHVGSSGVIPVESRTITPIYPINMPIVPITEGSMYRTTTYPPEIIKFSPEDAKVPDHYLNLRKSDLSTVTENQNIHNWDYSENTEKYAEDVETETLIIKLKNMIETTTTEDVFEEKENSEIDETYDSLETTTSGTYVPQINGHHRHMNYKSLTTLLRENSERYRKKRIENLITTRTIQNNTYVPMYVEIKRNRSTFDYEEN
nr:uncharacterized protein LOC117982077 [Maniola hyperantus]